MLFAWIFAVILFSVPALADTCNTCTRDKDGVLSCTLLHCQQPETLLECDDTLQNCEGVIVKENACYKKMQEAMRTMDEAIKKALETKHGGFYDMMIIAIYDKDKAKWDQAMRECVK
jgi:hypothetical protein